MTEITKRIERVEDKSVNVAYSGASIIKDLINNKTGQDSFKVLQSFKAKNPVNFKNNLT